MNKLPTSLRNKRGLRWCQHDLIYLVELMRCEQFCTYSTAAAAKGIWVITFSVSFKA